MLGKKSTVIFRKGIGVMGKYGQGFAKIFLWTVIFVFLLSSTCFASKYEVLQFKAIVPVIGPETDATVSLERGSKIILDASEDAIAGTYSWKYLGGPSEIKLWNKTTPSAYFWAGKPGVYRFALEIKQGDTVIETREVTLTTRALHYVMIDGFSGESTNIRTRSIEYPSEWPLLDISPFVNFADATTIKTPSIDVKGSANPNTVTLQCKNLTTGL